MMELAHRVGSAKKELLDGAGLGHHIPGFLEQAGIHRFSICFNDGLSPGVLRLGVDSVRAPHTSVGKDHWALDLRGISAGSHPDESQALFCNRDARDSVAGECAMIP